MTVTNISRIGNLQVNWEEFKRESLCGFHQKLFNLLDSHRRDIDSQYDPKDESYSEVIQNDRIVILSNFKYIDEGGSSLVNNEIEAIVEFFLHQNENTIVIAEVGLAALNECHIEEEYISIPDEITKLSYQISNHGNVLDEEGEIVPQVYFDDGPRVYIPSDDGIATGYFYSVPLLMVKTFNPIMDAGENQKMVKIASELTNFKSSLEKSGFVNIHDEFKHVLRIPYLYTDNTFGLSIYNKIDQINKSF